MFHIVAAALLALPPLPTADPLDPSTLHEWHKQASETVRRHPKAEWSWSGATEAHLELIRGLSGEFAAKQQYVEFLKETYGYNVERLKVAYGIEVSSFTEMTSLDYRLLDRSREAVRRDDTRFLATINETLFADASKLLARRIQLSEKGGKPE